MGRKKVEKKRKVQVKPAVRPEGREDDVQRFVEQSLIEHRTMPEVGGVRAERRLVMVLGPGDIEAVTDDIGQVCLGNCVKPGDNLWAEISHTEGGVKKQCDVFVVTSNTAANRTYLGFYFDDPYRMVQLPEAGGNQYASFIYRDELNRSVEGESAVRGVREGLAKLRMFSSGEGSRDDALEGVQTVSTNIQGLLRGGALQGEIQGKVAELSSQTAYSNGSSSEFGGERAQAFRQELEAVIVDPERPDEEEIVGLIERNGLITDGAGAVALDLHHLLRREVDERQMLGRLTSLRTKLDEGAEPQEVLDEIDGLGESADNVIMWRKLDVAGQTLAENVCPILKFEGQPFGKISFRRGEYTWNVNHVARQIGYTLNADEEIRNSNVMFFLVGLGDEGRFKTIVPTRNRLTNDPFPTYDSLLDEVKPGNTAVMAASNPRLELPDFSLIHHYLTMHDRIQNKIGPDFRSYIMRVQYDEDRASLQCFEFDLSRRAELAEKGRELTIDFSNNVRPLSQQRYDEVVEAYMAGSRTTKFHEHVIRLTQSLFPGEICDHYGLEREARERVGNRVYQLSKETNRDCNALLRKPMNATLRGVLGTRRLTAYMHECEMAVVREVIVRDLIQTGLMRPVKLEIYDETGVPVEFPLSDRARKEYAAKAEKTRELNVQVSERVRRQMEGVRPHARLFMFSPSEIEQMMKLRLAVPALTSEEAAAAPAEPELSKYERYVQDAERRWQQAEEERKRRLLESEKERTEALAARLREDKELEEMAAREERESHEKWSATLGQLRTVSLANALKSGHETKMAVARYVRSIRDEGGLAGEAQETAKMMLKVVQHLIDTPDEVPVCAGYHRQQLKARAGQPLTKENLVEVAAEDALTNYLVDEKGMKPLEVTAYGYLECTEEALPAAAEGVSDRYNALRARYIELLKKAFGVKENK